MEKKKDYSIPFEGLKVGLHHFQFEVDKEFFASFEGSEIEEAKLSIAVVLEKKENMMQVDTQIEGELELACDRCGSEMRLPLATEDKLVVKYGDETEQIDDTVLMLGPAEHHLDLGRFFYEYAHLALPLRRVHEDIEDCNPKAIAALDEFGYHSDDDDDEEDTDPRWDALKNLK